MKNKIKKQKNVLILRSCVKFTSKNIAHHNNENNKSLLVICWNNIIEELEDVPHSEEKL